MDEHTFPRRLISIWKDDDIQPKMLSAFNMDLDTYIEVVKEINNKILRKNHQSYTTLEQKMMKYAYNLDKKDHFQDYMDEHQVVSTIQEAYQNAKKISKSQYSKVDDTDLDYSIKGCTKYEGKSKELIIHFWFSFDEKCIKTAYPVFKSKSNKKHKKGVN
jgi:hypothetical protein